MSHFKIMYPSTFDYSFLLYVELYNRLSHVAENKREIIHKMSYLFNQLNSVEM